MSARPPGESDPARPLSRDYESGISPGPTPDAAGSAAATQCDDTGTPHTPIPSAPKSTPPTSVDLKTRRTATAGDSRTDTLQWKPPPANTGVIPGYEILATIGRGAMGVVYQARQISLNRIVALKVMVAGSHASEEDRLRFRTEALTVAQIQHPNVIQVYDVGEYDGMPFLAVEYVSGGNLQQWLGNKPMSVSGAVRLIYSIARAVGAAHQKGIVHRDLKPANILLTADGVPKVADFGLAKQIGGATYTTTGTILGTPQYMFPEQAAGLTKRIGPPSDVYSLGVILYQCLTGRPPFTSESVLQLLDQIRFGQPPSVRDWRSDVPEEVEAVCLRCLHKVPEERYRNADVLADELARIINRWEADRAREENPPATESTGLARIFTTIGLIAAVLLVIALARDAGWFTPRPKANPNPPPPVDLQKVLPPNAST